MELGKGLKLVVFDFDGTLFHLNIDYDQLRISLGIDGSVKIGDYVQDLIRQQHPDLGKVTTIELAAVGNTHVDQNIERVLAELSKRYRIAILTRNSRYAVKAALKTTAMESDDSLLIVGREDVRNLKPHVEGLELIERRFGIKPAETVMVGDTTHDVDVAKRNGAVSIVVKNRQLSFAPHSADIYVDKLADLLELL